MVARKYRIAYALILAILVIGETVDTVYDYQSSGITYSLGLDVALLLSVSFGILYILKTTAAEVNRTHRSLEKLRRDSEEFRRKNLSTLEDMRQAILAQFVDWKFSPVESTIAELLIRGLSTKQIAARLEKSERTVRNQSLAIYAKSGMTGRSDLAAFFLHDILGEDQTDSFRDEE